MEPVPEDLGIVVLTREQREDLRELYDNAGETRYTDVLIRWAISAVMFALNSALFVFAVPLALKGEIAAVFVAGTQLWFILLWYGLETRIQGLVEYWLSKLIGIEELLQPVLRVFGGVEYIERVINVRFTTHRILIWMIRSFGVLGIVIITIFAYATVRTVVHPPPPAPPSVQEVLQQGFMQLDKRMEELERQIVLLQQAPKPELPTPPKRAPQPTKGKRK